MSDASDVGDTDDGEGELSPAEAIRPLRARLGFPVPDDDSGWPAAVAELGALFLRYDDPESAARANAVAAAPTDTEALYQLAWQLYELGLFDLGAGMLARADALEPGDARILGELSSCLESLGRNRDAAEVIARYPAAQIDDPMLIYLLAFNRILAGQIEDAREPVERLLDLGDALPDAVAPLPPLLVGMLGRADALAAIDELGPESLRGWQAAINGDLLLHLSPFGFEEGMRGRYAWLGDSAKLIAGGLAQLERLFAGPVERPQAVLALADPTSRAMAIAAAQRLELPLSDFAEGDERPGLIPVYDLDGLQDPALWGRLKTCRPGQRLWVHGGCWTNPFPFAPDFTGLLFQARSGAFAPGMLASEEERQKPPPPVEEQAERILAEEVDDEALGLEPEQLTRIAEALATLEGPAAPGFRRDHGPRLRAREGSPVKSNRFA